MKRFRILLLLASVGVAGACDPTGSTASHAAPSAISLNLTNPPTDTTPPPPDTSSTTRNPGGTLGTGD